MSLKEKRMQKLKDGITGKSLKCNPRDSNLRDEGSEGRFMDCKVNNRGGKSEHVGVITDNVKAEIKEGTGSWSVRGTRGGATNFRVRQESGPDAGIEVTKGVCYDTEDDPRGYFCTLNVETKEE